MAKKDYTLSMKNAEASVRMEGRVVTQKMRQQCIKVLDDKTTTAECLKRLVASKTPKAGK